MTQIELENARSNIRKNNVVINRLEKIDWEQRRYEVARDIFPFAAKNMCDILMKGARIDGSAGKTVMQLCAESALNYADALIAELKKGGEECQQH